MLRVGLTGSIGVGKTFVSNVFSELGCHVIDADDIAREVVTPGSPALERVVGEFGPGILQEDGTLDRPALGKIVFRDAVKRRLLNTLLHPYIIACQDKRLRDLEVADPNGIGMVDAALMIESGGSKRFDKLIVVHCRPDLQLKRVMNRDKLTKREARRRIGSQMSQEEKKAFANYLIDTSDGFESAREQTAKVHAALIAEAQRRANDPRKNTN
jgi:dephospho-CoA kinase